MVEVYWEQDESGALCISGHSHEVPIPSNAELPPVPPSTTSRRGVFGRRGQLHGTVIDPDQIPETLFLR